MISKRTLAFLSALAKNNNREWFERHKDEFHAHHEEFVAFGNEIAGEIARFDPAVKRHLLDPKTVKVFRIYRDARFSHDKRPYKTNFGLVITPGGMERGAGVYYLHIEPGNSFVGGGLYRPSAAVLSRVRKHIASDHKKLRAIIAAKAFKSVFGSLSEGDTLKTAPRGISPDHPAIDLLRLKSFTAITGLRNADVTSPGLAKTVITVFKAIKPLNDFLSQSV